MKGHNMIKVLLVDDHDLVRAGIRRLMEDHSATERIEVVAEAASGEEAVDQVRQYSPDVVLLDVNMPGIGGLEAARRMLRVDPEVRIIALTVYEEGPLLKRMIDAGAMGYLTKGCEVSEMVTAIRRVSRGERYIASEIAQRLALGMLPGAESSPLEALSNREMQILLMLTQGQKPQVISRKLHLSPKTVSTYKTRLQEKLNVRSDVELIRLAMQCGMLDKSVTD
jgi:two-component system invasion response regulator UvrY